MTDAGPDDSAAPLQADPVLDQRYDRAVERLRHVRSTVETERESAEDEQLRQRSRDRSEIARIIVWLFAGSFLLVLPAIAWQTKKWDAVGAQLIDLLSSVLLPVLTLVIGYNFGTEQQNRQQGGR